MYWNNTFVDSTKRIWYVQDMYDVLYCQLKDAVICKSCQFQDIALMYRTCQIAPRLTNCVLFPKREWNVVLKSTFKVYRQENRVETYQVPIISTYYGQTDISMSKVLDMVNHYIKHQMWFQWYAAGHFSKNRIINLIMYSTWTVLILRSLQRS